MTAFVFYETFMRGQPGHENLREATYLEELRTAPVTGSSAWTDAGLRYLGRRRRRDRLRAVRGLRGALARLAEVEPAGWERAPVELTDGRIAEAFLGTPDLHRRGVDISAHGGWARFVRV